MAKKDNKKGKDKKSSSAGKAGKPAKSKPVAKAAKPAAKKKAAPKPAKKAAPAKKPAAKTGSKKEEKTAKAEKETKKPLTASAKKTESEKPRADKKFPGKDELKKVKPSAEELEGEDLELEEDIDTLELESEGAADDEDLLEEEDAPKPKGGKAGRRKKRKGDEDDDDHVFDSDNLMRKQPIKIDLNKSLIRKGSQEQPKPFVNTSDNRTRYSDAELAEFKELILEKLKEAETDYELLKSTLSNKDNHGTDDTSPTFKLLEDGSDVLSKEETAQLAARQEKYIISLRNALVRIENKSYGICRVTGKLIPKERLRSVPHATLGIDAKLSQSNN